MTSKAEQKPLPYHKEIHQYFLCLTKFLDITTFENNNPNNENNTNDGSNSLRSQKARAKLLKLSNYNILSKAKGIYQSKYQKEKHLVSEKNYM